MRRRPAIVLVAFCVAVLLAVGNAPSADAAFGIKGFDGGAFEADGTPAAVAGGHPHEASADLEFNWTPVERFPGFPMFGVMAIPEGDVKDVSVDLPPGFVANPQAVPQCYEGVMQDTQMNLRCPSESQVGIVKVGTAQYTEGTFSRPQPPGEGALWTPLYNMAPPHGVAAQFGFNLAGVVTHINARLRDDGSYGATADVENASQADGVFGSEVILWGVPADGSHDSMRGACLGDGGPVGDLCPADAAVFGQGARAFVTNPMDCSVGRIRTSVRADSWQEPGVWHSAFFDSDVNGDPIRVEGCDELGFDPSFTARPDSGGADLPSGLSFDLRFPQDGLLSPNGRATAHLKRASVTLPEGMTVNPAAAGGLAACSDEQLGYKMSRPSACPEGSKIGSVVAESPLLDEKVEGGVYVGSQLSGDPASGEMFRLFIVLKNEARGLDIKLPGSVRVDPRTGRIVTIFDNNPQLPVSRIALRVKAGERAPLALPTDCGAKQVKAEFTSWSGHVVSQTDSFRIQCPGADGFAPTFEAGSIDSTGGAFSPFAARIERPAGQQFLSGVEVDLPKGLVAKLRGVELCPDSAASDSTPGHCPADSRIGTATVGAGAGRPFYLQGPVYLTGPYKGAPYGLSTHVHAKAGPFDLGMVKVRQALHVDPETAEVSVVSDLLPQVVKGVPVRLRDVRVDVDREGFAINPTSCSEKEIDAKLTSINGTVSGTASRFQVGDCQALGFRPRMAMRLVGKGRTQTGAHPRLRAVVTQRRGQANIRRVEVALPRSVVLDARNAYDPKLVCDYDASLKADCPQSSVIGKAVANTPVLGKPLAGKVHLVQGIRFGPRGNRVRTTPLLLVKLRGEVDINVRARTTVKRNRLVTIFPTIPDAPVSKFTMGIDGGRKGILVITRTRQSKIDVCDSRQTADVDTRGHNGEQADFRTALLAPCGKQVKRRRH